MPSEVKGLWKQEILSGNSDLATITGGQQAPAQVPYVEPSAQTPSYREVPELPEEVSRKQIRVGTQDVQAPKFWDQNARNLFNSLNPNQKKVWLNSFKVQEKAFNKAVESMKTDLKLADDIRPLITFLAPYANNIEAQGKDFIEYLRGLFRADQMLINTPLTAIHKIMNLTGITIRDIEMSAGEYLNDIKQNQALIPLQERVMALENEKEVQRRQAEAEMTEDVLEAFMSATDRSGNLLHPLANDPDVRDAMSKIIAVNYTGDEGLSTKDLSGIYHDACVLLGKEGPRRRRDDMTLRTDAPQSENFAPSNANDDDVVARRISNWRQQFPDGDNNPSLITEEEEDEE